MVKFHKFNEKLMCEYHLVISNLVTDIKIILYKYKVMVIKTTVTCNILHAHN